MKIGTITQVSGPVVDVEFEAGHLPKIKEALSVELNGQTRVMEVAQHMSERVVRCIMLAGSEGLARGMKVTAPGKTIDKAQPEDVRFIMIDPKMLELSVYEGIPHLLTEVVTDMKDAANALRWCVNEMERRYKLMSALIWRVITKKLLKPIA